MDDIIYKKYKLAGKIASESRDYGATLIKHGASYLDIVEKVESKIVNSGAGIAFPVNIAKNKLAAHFTPTKSDTITIQKGDVIKLDVGAHVDGYIADTAVTVEVGTNNYSDMIKASSEGLDKAIEQMKDNVNLSDIGSIVEDTITSYGYTPIDNLTGHSLERYDLHSGLSVPSVSKGFNKNRPKTDDVLAIEPFATDGSGHVVGGDGSNIFLCDRSLRSKIVRDRRAKILFSRLLKAFNTLPFAQRWCKDLFPNDDLILRKLSYLGLIKNYPQLIEANGGIVTQKEHTVIVKDNECEVIT